MDPDTINCVIMRTHVDIKSLLAQPSSGEQVGVKKDQGWHESKFKLVVGH